MSHIEFGILGPLTVVLDGDEVHLGALKLRTLLIRLLIESGHPVPADRLIEDLWEGSPPRGAESSLRAYISNLRRRLGDEAASGLVTRGGGYGLVLDIHGVDADRFATAVESAHAQRVEGRHATALATLEDALGLWRGPALADVAYASFAQPTIHRLDELRNLAKEERTAALLASGRHDAAVPELESMIAAEPLRERPYRQLSLALYRTGRTAEALEVHRRLRERLADELGLDPSPGFDALVARILRQDPQLDVEAGHAEDSIHGRRREAGPHPLPTTSIRAGPGARGSGIVGRERERRQLVAALDRLAGGDGGLVLLTGEPGIGKTTLLEELAGHAVEIASVHWGHCPESEGAPGFWPWRQVLGSVVASSSSGSKATLERWRPVLQLIPKLAEQAGVAPPEVHDPVKSRFALFEATAGFLAEVATVRPQVIVLDDLQWSDPASLELLAFLAENSGAAPILVAASYRSAPADRSPALQRALARLHRRPAVVALELEGLDQRDIAELVGASDDGSEAREVASLHHRTDGNPFFVDQLVQFLREDPRQRAEAAIPAGVRHVIANRLKLLPVPTQGLLEAAAVVGRSFDTRLVASVVDRPVEDVMDELDLAHDHELIEPDDLAARRHRFVHPLIQETLRDGLSPAKGARLHAATARVLASSRDAPPEQLAEHLWLAGELAPEGATVPALVAAADVAAGSLAYEQAEMLLRRALDVLVRGARVDIDAEVDVRSRLLNLLTTVTGWSSTDLAPIADRVWQLADEVGLRPDLLPMWHLLWTGLTARGETERSREVALELRRRAADAGDELYTHTAELLLGYLDTHAGKDLPGTLRRIVAARDGLDRQPDAHLAATPEHLGVTARLIEVNARGFLGDPHTRTASEQLIAYAQQVGRPFSRMAASLFAGQAAAVQGDAEAAADWTRAGLDLCERHGFAGARHLFVPVDGWARVRLGADPAQEVRRIGESVTALEVSRGQVPARYLVLYSDVLARAGDLAGARQRLEQARRFVEATGERVYDALIAQAWAALPTANGEDAPS